MAISYESIISSAPFKFLVGPEKRPFVIHAALVAHYSKPLDVLVNGKMSEAIEGCAYLDDVDEDTFVRFGQYLYTGDYSEAGQEDLSDYPVVFGDVAPVDVWEWSSNRNRVPASPGSKKSEMWRKFQSTSYPTSTPASHPHRSFEISAPALLSHPRLYAFAEKYDIPPLKNHCLHKLHRTLSAFTLHEDNVGDIVKLLQYSYEATPDHEGGELDGLRQLVTNYAACVVEQLSRDKLFQGLLEDGGQFARDIVQQMVKETE